MNTVNEMTAAIETALRQGDVDIPVSLSGMQPYRRFLAEVGYTPSEYMRRRRLSIALERMRTTDKTDIEIAYHSGYSSQQAMCREIRTLLGITARAYRRSSEFYYFPPYTGGGAYALHVGKECLPEVTALQYRSSTLSGLESRAVHAFLSQNPSYGGRLFGRNGTQTGGQFCYRLYVELDDEISIHGFEKEETFPAFTANMAVISTPNAEPRIKAAWDWLYTQWLPYSCYQYAGEQDPTHETAYFEEYLWNTQYPYRLKLYLPVVRAAAFHRLRLQRRDFIGYGCAASGQDAEACASKVLITGLQRTHPYILRKTCQFLLCRTGNACISGILTEEVLPFAEPQYQRIFYHRCACVCMEAYNTCDAHRIRQILYEWTLTNGLLPDDEKPLFIIYTTENSYAEFCLPIKNTNLL